jgi:hypothetical protein
MIQVYFFLNYSNIDTHAHFINCYYKYYYAKIIINVKMEIILKE